MKDKSTAAVLALFTGGLGGQKFYLGKSGSGVMSIMFCWTMIPAFVGLVEAIQLALMNQKEFNLRYNTEYLLPAVAPQPPPQQQPQNLVVNVQNTANAVANIDIAGQIKSLHELQQVGALTA